MKKNSKPPVSQLSPFASYIASPVLRLRFEVSDSDWKIIKKIRIPSMTIPKQHAVPSANKFKAEFWVDLTDTKGNLLYRVVRNSPFTQSKEVVNQNGRFVREDITAKSVIFDILLPEIETMHKIKFFTTPITDKHTQVDNLPRDAKLVKEFLVKQL